MSVKHFTPLTPDGAVFAKCGVRLRESYLYGSNRNRSTGEVATNALYEVTCHSCLNTMLRDTNECIESSKEFKSKLLHQLKRVLQ